MFQKFSRSWSIWKFVIKIFLLSIAIVLLAEIFQPSFVNASKKDKNPKSKVKVSKDIPEQFYLLIPQVETDSKFVSSNHDVSGTDKAYDEKLWLRLKRGFGYGHDGNSRYVRGHGQVHDNSYEIGPNHASGLYGSSNSYNAGSGYGGTNHNSDGHSTGYGYGGAASIAQQAANQAKAAANAQGTAAHQAAQQARSILANQASKAAAQAKAVTAAKQIHVSQITQAVNAAQSAAYAEASQAAKTRAAVQSAEAVKYSAARLAHSHYGGHAAQEQLYAAKRALQQARSVAQWQAQMAYQAQQNAKALSRKLEAALHDLHLAQQATNKAAWAASQAQSSIIGYGHGY